MVFPTLTYGVQTRSLTENSLIGYLLRSVNVEKYIGIKLADRMNNRSIKEQDRKSKNLNFIMQGLFIDRI